MWGDDKDKHGEGGDDMLVGGEGNDYLDGEKGSDMLFADLGNDVLRGGGDGDDFVFGFCTDNNGQKIDHLVFDKNIIADFDDDQDDRIVFHTSFDGQLTATIVDGVDVVIDAGAAGKVKVLDLVTELDGLDPADPFFDESKLMEFLTKTGTDGSGKGVIYFEDKCVMDMDIKVRDPNTEWNREMFPEAHKTVDLSHKYIGDTTIRTTEVQMADLFLDETENASLMGNTIWVDLTQEVV